MAILDLYNNSKIKEKDADKQRTDFITNKTFGTEAVTGFTPKLKIADKNKTDFKMVDMTTNTTVKVFQPINMNGSKEAPFFPGKTYLQVTPRK
jgi:hypothetical protein